MPENNAADYEEWFVDAVKHALEEAEAGQVVDHETVLKRLKLKLIVKLDPDR
jgi:predicted transcriptional regulator